MLSCPLSHERSYLYILVDVERRVMGCILLTSQQESGTWSYLGMWTRHHKKQQAKSWKWEGMLCQKLGFSFTLLNIISVIGSSSIIDLTKGNRNINGLDYEVRPFSPYAVLGFHLYKNALSITRLHFHVIRHDFNS